MKLKYPDQTPIIVHQMGKVASTSVNTSLARLGCYDVFHTHRLNRRTLDIRLSLYKRKDIPVPRVDAQGDFICENFIKSGRKVLLVSLVREPIARNISAYFENLDNLWGVENAHTSIPMADLLNKFVQDYDHEIPSKWFDTEVRDTVGIDVFDYSFPMEAGYGLISNEKADLLIMKHDLDDDSKGVALGELLGVGPVSVEQANVSQNKKYGDVYSSFREQIRLDPQFVRDTLNSQYAKHFYCENDLRKFYERWA